MPDPLLIAARAVDFGALAQFAGLFIFLRLVIEPALLVSQNPEGSGSRRRRSAANRFRQYGAMAWS
jgi:hypothetical protein